MNQSPFPARGCRMSNIMKSILTLMVIICIQIIVYTIFLRPLILTWGASENEVKMPLVGDSFAPYISSTRAISINAPISEVWKWLIQLGPDRGGFFSYTFIEKALGYKGIDKIIPEFQEMKVGRIIPGSLNQSKSIIKYSWTVMSVEPGKSFVLKNWGAFVLKKINTEQTRLIIRTHGWETPTLMSKLGYFVMMPLHYIMERRMLMGIKTRAEAGAGFQLSSTSDVLWFSGIVLSYLGIVLMVFILFGIQKYLMPSIYGVLWLIILLVFKPQPIYSNIFLFLVAATAVWIIFKNRRQSVTDTNN